MLLTKVYLYFVAITFQISALFEILDKIYILITKGKLKSSPLSNMERAIIYILVHINLWVATIFCLARTHIRTLDFRPHARRTHVCVLPKSESHTHTHVYSIRVILKQILHFFFLLSWQNKVQNWALFYPKTCENCDRTSHTWTAARTHIARTF